MKTLDRRRAARLLPLALAAAAVVSLTATQPGTADRQGGLRQVATIVADAPASTWTSVNSQYGSTSYWTNSRDAIRVGRNGADNAVWRSFLQAPLLVPGGAAILSATFHITLVHSWSCTPTPVQLHQVNLTLNPATPVTWNNSSGVWGPGLATAWATANSAGGCGTNPSVVVTFSGPQLTAAVQNAVTAGASTFTLGLRAPNEGDITQWKRFAPTGAHLTITYSD
jgi:hypothetical protein